MDTTFQIQTREIPDRLILTEERVVGQPELEEWVKAAFGRVYDQAAALGNPDGPGMLIFHGEVTKEKSSRVEATIVIPADTPKDRLPANSRLDPAHHEAYTRITKAQNAFPGILEAYDAVSTWIRERGHEVADSPREVYFRDFMAAAEDDEVCDISFPYR